MPGISALFDRRRDPRYNVFEGSGFWRCEVCRDKRPAGLVVRRSFVEGLVGTDALALVGPSARFSGVQSAALHVA